VVAAVHRAADLAALPGEVFGGGHLGQLAADLGGVEALGGQPVEHAVALGVGVEGTHRNTSYLKSRRASWRWWNSGRVTLNASANRSASSAYTGAVVGSG